MPQSVHVPRTVREWRLDPSSEVGDPSISGPEATLILMCNDGYSSSLAAANLLRLGFEHAGDMIGGFRAWEAAGLPVGTC